jgi:hypothetical protein
LRSHRRPFGSSRWTPRGAPARSAARELAAEAGFGYKSRRRGRRGGGGALPASRALGPDLQGRRRGEL